MKGNYLYYKYKFFIRYTIIGFISIVVELLFYNLLNLTNIINYVSLALSLSVGILFAFYANIKFNFNIVKSKRLRAMIYFSLISLSSWILQKILSTKILISNYELSRILISALVFVFFYYLHRKFSFKEIKRIGVAVYLNEKENFNTVFEKVENYPDFIHTDLVDETFLRKSSKNNIEKIKIVKKLWPKKEIHTHIMSKTPTKWIDFLKNYSDLIYIHWEINEDINTVINKIKSLNLKIGIALQIDTELKVLKNYIKEIDSILLMSIDNLGKSGNLFNEIAITRIKEIRSSFNLKNVRICADGGISENVIMRLNCEDVVSGSFILNSSNPKLDIIRLKTSIQYEIL